MFYCQTVQISIKKTPPPDIRHPFDGPCLRYIARSVIAVGWAGVGLLWKMGKAIKTDLLSGHFNRFRAAFARHTVAEQHLFSKRDKFLRPVAVRLSEYARSIKLLNRSSVIFFSPPGVHSLVFTTLTRSSPPTPFPVLCNTFHGAFYYSLVRRRRRSRLMCKHLGDRGRARNPKAIIIIERLDVVQKLFFPFQPFKLGIYDFPSSCK